MGQRVKSRWCIGKYLCLQGQDADESSQDGALTSISIDKDARRVKSRKQVSSRDDEYQMMTMAKSESCLFVLYIFFSLNGRQKSFIFNWLSLTRIFLDFYY